MEQLATWKRTHGYDHDDSWVHGTRPLSPQEFTASLWSDSQELKDVISMSGRARRWQKAKKLLDGLEEDLPDEELAAIKRYVERRSREAAQVTVPPVSTVQPSIPCSLNPEIPPDVYVSMKEKDEGRMNPGPRELESPSAGMGLETPGQQRPPNEETCETERTIADRYLLVGMGSNQGETLLRPRNALVRKPKELRRQHLQHRTSLSCSRSTNPGTRHSAKRTSNLTPMGKERSHRFGTRL